MLVAHGTYTGDGTSGRGITGVGFAPQGALVHGDGATHLVLALSTFPAGKTKRGTSNAALETGYIDSLDANGFTITSTSHINTNGTIYHWVAWRAESGDSQILTYVGDGNATQVVNLAVDIPGTGGVVWVIPDAAQFVHYRHSVTTGDAARTFASGATLTSVVTALGASSITVAGALNTLNVTYHVFAFEVGSNVKVGSYSGNSTDLRQITAGIVPDYTHLGRIASSSGSQLRFETQAADASFLGNTNSAAATNRIQDEHASDGFILGTDATVNATSSTYYWWAWVDKADVVAPTATFAPADAATGVALGVHPVVTFSEAMDAATLTTTTITLKQGATVVPYIGSYDAAAFTWTLTPNSLLAPNTAHTVAVTTGCKDVAGNAVASLVDADWTTGGADTTPPVISAISFGATGISTAAGGFTTSELGTTEYRLFTSNPGTAYQGADLAGTIHPSPTDTATKVLSPHTIAVTGLTSATAYWAQVRSANADGATSNWSDAGNFTTANGNATIVTALQLHSTYNTIGGEVVYTDDADASVACGRFVVTTTAAAASSATTLVVAALPHMLYDNSLLMFSGGVQAVVNGTHAVGATSITVESLPAAIASGAKANYTAIRFKRSADTNWRYALRGHVVPLTGNKGIHFALLDLDADTTYDLEITINDAAGVTIPAGLPITHNDNALGNAAGSSGAAYGTITATNIPTKDDSATTFHNVDPTTLTPTYYVRTDGVDTNAGTADSAGGAWLTLEKAITFINALAGTSPVVVKVGAGHFNRPTTTIFNAAGRQVTFFAANRAADDTGAIANAGTHTILESQIAISGPSGATDPLVTVTPWASVQVTGQFTTPTTYQLWKWTGALSGTIPGVMGIAANRTDVLEHIASWAYGGSPTLGRLAELMYTNSNQGGTYRFGWFYFGNDLYVRLPGDANPNLVYCHFGAGTGFSIQGPNVRVSGFEMRAVQQGVDLIQQAVEDAAIDHNHIHGARYGVIIHANKSAGLFGRDVTIQSNRLTHNLFYHEDGSGVPWNWIKGSTYDSFGNLAVGGTLEGAAVQGSGGAHRTVIRHNYARGTFNGFAFNNSGYPRYSLFQNDWHHNYIAECIDDAFEPERAATNLRIWSNTVEKCITFLSLAPVDYSPIYLWRNTAWRITQEGLGEDENGQVENVGGAPGGKLVKHEKSSAAYVQLHLYHNTWHTDQAGIHGIRGQSGGSLSYRWDAENNVIRTGGYIVSVGSPGWQEGHGFYATSDQARGLEYNGTLYASAAAYRAASGQGVGTNLAQDNMRDVTTLDAAFTSVATGDLTPTATSPLRNLGTYVPNISDQPNQIVGTAPDIGALEQGTVDSTAPTISTGPTLGTPTQTSISATWTLSEPGTGRFKVWTTAGGEGTATYFDDNLTSLSHTIGATGLTANTAYTYRVVGADAATNAYQSSTGTFTTAATPDNTAPTMGTISVAPTGPTGALATWPTDELASTVLRYRVVGAPAWITLAETDTSPRVLAHSVTLSGLVEETNYEVQVAGTDASGNTSAFSASATFTTPDDGLAPTRLAGTFTVTTTAETVVFESVLPATGNFEYGVGAAFNLTAGYDTEETTTHTGTLTVTPGVTYHWRYVGHLSDNTEVQSDPRAIETVGASGRVHRRGGLLRI